MSLQQKQKNLSYKEQLAVVDAVLERVENSFEEFKEELTKEIKFIHDQFVRKDDFNHKLEDINKNIHHIDTKMTEGFSLIEKRLADGKKITEWLRQNFLILLGVGLTVLWLIDHIKSLKEFFL
jgi:phosphoenolpyruvate carboxylase